MDPREALSRLSETIGEDLTLFALGVEGSDLLDALDRLTRFYPVAGIALMLTTGEQSRYRETLVRAAWARLRQLGVAMALHDRRRATSFNEGLFAALVAGHWPLVRDIAAACPSDWVPEGEYEDDFCHYRLIGLLTGDDLPTTAHCQPLLDRFEQVLEGEPSARLAVDRALLARDPLAFPEAFDDFLREEREALMEARARLGEPDETGALIWMRGYVSIEALALLRLAERFEIAPPGPHPLCPPGALPVGPCPNYPDPFAEIEAAR